MSAIQCPHPGCQLRAGHPPPHGGVLRLLAAAARRQSQIIVDAVAVRCIRALGGEWPR